MDNPQLSGHPATALSCTILSVVSGIVASVLANVEIYVRIGAGFIAIASGFMAARYYYYATKDKIQSLKK